MIISDTVLTISSHIPFLLYSWIWAWVDKTVITLTALNDLIFDQVTVSKVLVIAPLRVAQVSWPNEVKK